MEGWSGAIGLRVLAVVLCLVAGVWLALWYFIPAPPTKITMDAGLKGSAFEHIANRYREKLAKHHVTLSLHFINAPGDNLKLINDPRSGVVAGFVFGGQTNSEASPDIESLGRISAAPLWIFYTGSETLDRLTQLKGRRIYWTTALDDFIGRILAVHGVSAADRVTVKGVGLQAVTKALHAGDIDVAIEPPIDVTAPAIQSLLRDPNVRLMNVTQAEALTRLFPSLNRLVLPQGVIDLEKNIPRSDVNLIGSSSAVVVRKELHPELKYLLAETLKEVHRGGGVFQRVGEFPTQIDPEFPMAEEALDYYRNGPSFLQRYLPFWTINYAKRVAAILVAAIAVVIPLFTYGPRLYEWLLRNRLIRLYRRLRAVNARLKGSTTANSLAALQAELDEVDRAANILPLRHSDLFFSLLMHIDMTRTRLAARLATLQRLGTAA